MSFWVMEAPQAPTIDRRVKRGSRGLITFALMTFNYYTRLQLLNANPTHRFSTPDLCFLKINKKTLFEKKINLS